MKPLFVILFRPTWAEIYLVESYDEGARGGVCLCQTSYHDAQRMAWGIEMAGGDVRSAWIEPRDTDKWRRRLVLWAVSTEQCIPYSTRVRGTEGFSAQERARRLIEAVARVKSAVTAKKKRKR